MNAGHTKTGRDLKETAWSRSAPARRKVVDTPEREGFNRGRPCVAASEAAVAAPEAAGGVE